MIAVGQPAPQLEAQDTQGRTVRLDDYRGRTVLVYFMRSTSCPMCNLHVRELTSHAAALAERDVEVLVAVPEERDEAAAWASRRGVPFRVLTSRPHASFGLARRMLGSMMQSGTVIVDERGDVHYADIVTVPTGGFRWRRIEAALAELRTDATA